SRDERIQSVQMMRADQDRNFTYREAFVVPGAKFVTLADTSMRDVDVSQDGRWAVGRDTRGYVSDYKAPAADADRQGSTDRPARVRHLARWELLPLLEGQQVSGVQPRRRNDEDAGRRDECQLRRRRVRSSGAEAVVWDSGY